MDTSGSKEKALWCEHQKDFEPNYEIPAEKKRTRQLKEEAKNADCISWHPMRTVRGSSHSIYMKY